MVSNLTTNRRVPVARGAGVRHASQTSRGACGGVPFGTRRPSTGRDGDPRFCPLLFCGSVTGNLGEQFPIDVLGAGAYRSLTGPTDQRRQRSDTAGAAYEQLVGQTHEHAAVYSAPARFVARSPVTADAIHDGARRRG